MLVSTINEKKKRRKAWSGHFRYGYNLKIFRHYISFSPPPFPPLGIHAEGPFINSKKKGAHKATHVQEELLSEDEMMSTYTSLDNISIVTLAPELSGSNKVIPWLVEKGIVVSLGEANASFIIQSKYNVGKSALFLMQKRCLKFLVQSALCASYNCIEHGYLCIE